MAIVMSDLSVTIRSRNVHDHDLDLQNGPRSIVNMPFERLHLTSFVLAIAVLALSSFGRYSHTVEMCVTLTFRIGQDQMNTWQSKGHMQLSLCYQY